MLIILEKTKLGLSSINKLSEQDLSLKSSFKFLFCDTGKGVIKNNTLDQYFVLTIYFQAVSLINQINIWFI